MALSLGIMFRLSRLRGFIFFIAWLILVGCSTDGNKQEEKKLPERIIAVPRFNPDSAFQFIEKQVGFGPRIPESPAHKQARLYLKSKLENYGANVIEQKFSAPIIEGRNIQLTNIIATFYPQKTKRVLLAAHWDTRPYADKDTENPNGKMDGANDGASGVGVILELARLIGADTSISIGVDIIFFDGEDWGEPENIQGQSQPPEGWDSWWCLGSQYWAKNKHKPNYAAYYGILLDMVGAKNSQFYREGASLQYAPRIVSKIWDTAARLGYNDYFVKQSAHAITDDHIYVNEWAKIPMVDIVHYQPGIGYFGDYHHSQKDNLSLIDKETLEAVGNTLLQVLYYEE